VAPRYLILMKSSRGLFRAAFGSPWPFDSGIFERLGVSQQKATPVAHVCYQRDRAFFHCIITDEITDFFFFLRLRNLSKCYLHERSLSSIWRSRESIFEYHSQNRVKW